MLSVTLLACRQQGEIVYPAEHDTIPTPPRADSTFAAGDPVAMYLINEGNMGSNKASIDLLDYRKAEYIRSIYTERNPNVVKELGDVGNDIAIYGSKLYAVINCSHKVEVMDARTCVRIGQIEMANCRYIAFAEGKAYITAYVSPEGYDNRRLGALYEVDTTSLRITRTMQVGYQPEELVVKDGYLYVANSGGFQPGYDSTLSIINIAEWREVKRLPVAINLHRLRLDTHGQLWLTARGDYGSTHPCLVCLKADGADTRVIERLAIECSNMAIQGDSLYYYTTVWDPNSKDNHVQYGILNTQTRKVLTHNFITDGTESEITIPYGIAIHPYNGDIYLTDAKNYVSSGTLSCYSRQGERRWTRYTGDIPARMCFLYP